MVRRAMVFSPQRFPRAPRTICPLVEALAGIVAAKMPSPAAPSPSTPPSLTMFDDGAHGDGAAGDGIFAATIPASASTNGQMVRYYLSATDVNANGSRWPLFTDPASTAEYLGTVVNPNYVTSA